MADILSQDEIDNMLFSIDDDAQRKGAEKLLKHLTKRALKKPNRRTYEIIKKIQDDFNHYSTIQDDLGEARKEISDLKQAVLYLSKRLAEADRQT